MGAIVTVICIIAAIFLIILSVLFVKVQLIVGYNDESKVIVKVKIKFLFSNITVFSLGNKNKKEKPKKEPKPKPKPEKKKKDKKEPKEKKRPGFTDKIKVLRLEHYLKLIESLRDDILKKLYFELFKVNIVAANGDAAKTAVFYGQLNAAIFPLAGLIYNNKKAKEMEIHIKPDFNKEKSEFDILFNIVTIPIHAVVFALKAYAYINRTAKAEFKAQKQYDKK